MAVRSVEQTETENEQTHTDVGPLLEKALEAGVISKERNIVIYGSHRSNSLTNLAKKLDVADLKAIENALNQ